MTEAFLQLGLDDQHEVLEKAQYAKKLDGRRFIEPTGPSRRALEQDYALMLADQVMIGAALPFDELMQACAAIAAAANTAADITRR